MTAPSPSLHVSPPGQADIKRFPENPPTPLTPQTSNSAMSSRAQLSDDSTYPPVPQTSLSPDLSSRKSLSDMPEADPVPESSKPVQNGTSEQDKRQDGAQTVEMPILGLKCAPPDVLPPSPPLTVADAREEPGQEEDPHAASSSSTRPRDTSAALPHMREEDITEWRASVHGTREEEDEDEDDANAPLDGEYDPYDLGYSPETPVGPSANRAGVTMGLEGKIPGQSALREAEDHPLKFEAHPPPSPPPWEVIPPPATNGALRVQGKGLPPRSTPSRPLIPHSAYYFGPPSVDAAYGTPPVGHIGVHHPREIVRIERDYSGGETVQFTATYPLELEGRITPTQFLETINIINERLIEAHSLRHSFIDNALAYFTLQLSRFILTSHYDKEMRHLRRQIDELNTQLYNPVGLNILWPREVAFMFLEIEYY